ncbi:right-handed parallel beta-helix repeat-containing protein [Nonomuraea sediminis]|uniref:right-handed parallel beta-helix repeat-containing protein n=1 Tax=Nonomuraea sediminis TaxID=2835864 RepID=UPI001BDD6EE3|nr:right-handed parallel beta-helix repeat-containing protein [Nonomuraea sediminis]
MKKACFAVLCGLLVSVALARPAAATGSADEIHFTYASSTSVVFDWRGTATSIDYGTTTGYGTTVNAVAPAVTPISSAGPFWQATLTGLAPDTSYHYSIGGGPDMVFRSPPSGAFRFEASGDMGNSLDFGAMAAVQAQMASDDPAFVFMVGDLTYAETTTQASVDQHFNDVMAWSKTAAYMPAWGNHEYENPTKDDLRNYKGRLLMPNAQTSPGAPAPGCCGNDWGWFDTGGVRFIAYPEPYTAATWTDWATKADALFSAAQADPSINFIVTYGHRPAYSTGSHPGDANLAGILDSFGATYSKYVLNLNGHSHNYERFSPIHGVTHITVGNGGGGLVTWTSPASPTTAYRALHYGHLRVDVGPTGLLIQEICGPSSSKDDVTCTLGDVIDQVTIGTPPVIPPPTTVYVDKNNPGCSDTGGGTALQPMCSITAGVHLVAPGQTVLVSSGTYTESVDIARSGTAAKPITVSAAPGASVTVTGGDFGFKVSGESYVTLKGFTVTGNAKYGIYLTGSDHVTVDGNTVTYAGQPVSGQTARGIYVSSTTDSVISANVAHHNSDSGIYLTSSAARVTVRGNTAYQNARQYERSANGIDVRGADVSVIGNVTYDNEDSGIQFYTGASNALAVNNVAYNNGDHGIDNLNVPGGTLVGNTAYRNCTTGINVEGTSSNYTIRNNVAVDNAVYPAYNGISCNRRAGNIGVWDSATSTTTADYNLVYLSTSGKMYAWGSAYTTLAAMRTATGQEVHGLQANPLLTANLHLQAGSPAIDSADSGATGALATDLEGNARYNDPATADTGTGPRTYDDRGAYEYH